MSVCVFLAEPSGSAQEIAPWEHLGPMFPGLFQPLPRSLSESELEGSSALDPHAPCPSLSTFGCHHTSHTSSTTHTDSLSLLTDWLPRLTFLVSFILAFCLEINNCFALTSYVASHFSLSWSWQWGCGSHQQGWSHICIPTVVNVSFRVNSPNCKTSGSCTCYQCVDRCHRT